MSAPFDWGRWIDQQRAAAEQRVNGSSTDAVIEDENYRDALNLWMRQREIPEQMQALRDEQRALVTKARRMAAQVERAGVR